MKVLELLLCSSALFACSYAGSGYLCIGPEVMHPGWKLSVVVTIAEATTQDPVVVVATVKGANDNALDSVSHSFIEGETKMLTMQIPDAVDPSQKYEISINGFGGLVFKERLPIHVDLSRSLVLVQTDKKIYRPAETVRFRVLNVDLDLKPVFHPLTVFMKNAKGSKLERYDGLNSQNGVVQESFTLPKYPTLGFWTIEVFDDSDKFLHAYNFSVEEFVPPKFSVDVKANPSYLTATNKEIRPSITVTSMYTYGKGVNGMCELNIISGKLKLAVVKKDMKDGEVEFTNIDWPQILEKVPETQLLITAEVTDPTDRSEIGEATLPIHRYDTTLEILPKSDFILRNSMEANIYIKVSDQEGNPVEGAILEIEIDIHEMNSIRTQITVETGQTEAKYSFTPHLTNDEAWIGWGLGGVKVILKSNPNIITRASINWYVSGVGSVYIHKPTSEVIRQQTDLKVEGRKTDQVGMYYLIFAQGKIVEAAKVPDSKTIQISPDATFCPSGKLVLYSILPYKIRYLVVADEVNFSPNVCFSKQTSVDFDAKTTRTGSNVRMTIRVDRTDGSNELPGKHDVFYLGIDKSIILMQGGTDLNEKRVKAGFRAFEDDSGYQRNEIMDSAKNIFMAAGLKATPSKYLSIDNEIVMMAEAARPMDAENFPLQRSDDSGANVEAGRVHHELQKNKGVEASQSETKVRKDFPDTWLFGMATTGMTGRHSQTVTLPDTITSWLVSAFAINKDDGLAVAGKPFELTSFKTFFLSMALPYSIKRGEIFVLRITVFNYRDEAVSAKVRLENTEHFSIVDEDFKDGWVENVIQIKPQMAASAEFQVNATILGMMDLHAIASDMANDQEDEVIRKLLVKPEGVESPQAITKVMRLEEDGKETENFKINWPVSKIIPDSQRVEVKITGEVLGQALKGLDSLVTQPFGCGEQNMITTVPNIFGLLYINNLNIPGMEDIKKEMIDNMRTGYRRQVDKYRHDDGSFSAWGDDGKSSGSTWLTAFVIKSFAQASQFISVDPAVLESGVQFLSKKQDKGGKFVEDGQVFHREMQSGSASGVGLTIYVLNSMLETVKALGARSPDVIKQSELALAYIEKHTDEFKNSNPPNKFLLAMTSYAYSLNSNPSNSAENKAKIDEYLNIVSDSGSYPYISSTPAPPSAKKVAPGGRPFQEDVIWLPPQVTPGKLEVVAYMLMTYSQLGDSGSGFPLMKWVQSQQNSKGGFRSTQDTVMVLQALSSFGMVYSGAANQGMVTVTVPITGQVANVNISGPNAILLQTVELTSPDLVNEVVVTLNGVKTNLAVVKVVYTFYTQAGDVVIILDDGETSPLSLVTKTYDMANNVHKVESCVRSKLHSEKGMMVNSVELPTAEAVMDDVNTLKRNNPKASNIEVGDGVIHYYLDEIVDEEICFSAMVENFVTIKDQKPGRSSFYYYYEPEYSEEVPVVLSQGLSTCTGTKCETDGAMTLNFASLFLTSAICIIISLLSCI